MSVQLLNLYERLFKDAEAGCGDFKDRNQHKAGSVLLEQFCVQEKIINSCPNSDSLISPFLNHLIGRQASFLICNGDYFVDFSDSYNWYMLMDEMYKDEELLLISYDLGLPDNNICLKLITSQLSSLHEDINTSFRQKLAKTMAFKDWQNIVPTFDCFFDKLTQVEMIEAFQFILKREEVIRRDE